MDGYDYELYIPDDYKYDDVDRNNFIQEFDTGQATDKQIEEAEKKGWIEKEWRGWD